MTDEELLACAEWLARTGAYFQQHIDIADEIKRRLALTRQTNVGLLPVSVDGIDRLDLAVARLADTVRKRDTEIEQMERPTPGFRSSLIGLDVQSNKRGADIYTRASFLLSLPMREIVAGRWGDFSVSVITPVEKE